MTPVISLITILAAVTVVTTAAPAQAPGVVGPGVVSTEINEAFPAQDPLGGALWFSRYSGRFSDQTIWFAEPTSDGWAQPSVAGFSGRWGDSAPRFSPDGTRLFFTSNRPVDGGDEAADMNIWVVSRDVNGYWGEPRLVPDPVSVPGVADAHNVVTRSGFLYLASARPGSFGRSDIYRIPMSGAGYGPAEHLGAPINDELSQSDLYVSPDESWMILVITDGPEGLGGDDLYISFFEEGNWTPARNLGAPINSTVYEYGPSLSHDGRYLLFTSHRNGSADIFRVPIEAVLESPD